MLQIVLLSFAVSGFATVIATISGIFLGTAIAMHNFRMKQFAVAIINTWMTIPSVLIGLLVYILINRKGVFGFLDLLFTPSAIVIGQSILATPIVCALTISALKQVAREIRETALSLGATNFQSIILVLKETKFALITALITAFGRIIGETGAAIVLGGNIKGYTQVMSTAIAIETLKGNFEFAIKLGFVLFATTLLINILLQVIFKKT
ncbi:MAG: ABC transporter permease [Elusimicrobiota bacterium]|nr:ABC transporter permease [Elusimicrobiota bacterium]